MRLFLLSLCLLIVSYAHAETFTCEKGRVLQTLGYLRVTASGGGAERLPIAQPLTVVGPDSSSNSVCKIRTANGEVSAQTQDLEDYTVGWRVRDIAPRQRCDNGEPIASPSGKCPSAGDVASSWNTDSAEDLLKNCPAPSLNLVRREDLRADPATCTTPKNQPAAESGAWSACPAPRECTAAEIKADRDAQSATQAAAKAAHCENKKYQAPVVNPPTAPATRGAPTNSAKSSAAAVPPNPRSSNCMTPFDHSIKKLVIHETDLAPNVGVAAIQRSHQSVNKWSDIGYHYMIAPGPDGHWRVYEGRSTKYEGAHAGVNLNSDSLGIVIAGSYDPAGPSAVRPAVDNSQPPPEATAQLHALIAKLKSQYPSIEEVRGHAEVRYAGLACNGHCPETSCETTCPGPGTMRMIHSLNERYFPAASNGEIKR